ncbi:restriction endonuclease subunit S [Staphylococcus shinii]|uniref:restriction endonuclease subunit S n=1 Tax=Staphylococcus shinii TaxID=2912228 RepID=UPI001AAFD19D|nr:restriction endonuclease subunit S [Staphylococcus shinii]MBO3064947.1 restriction endonuclease subunit S [Staphylococcus shinii]HIS17347.1 restriction endonuclease subunit S [Candidatus Coprovivens excrementavium]
MTNETKNVPELRFPEFSEKWSINIFGDVVTNKSSKYTPKKTEALIDIELDSIESNTGRLIKNYTSNDFSSQKNVFTQNQVLYSKLRPYLNKYYFPNFDGVCTSEIWVLDSKYSSTLSNEFLYYFIQTNKFKEVTNKSSGSKMPRADWNLVGNMRFNITSLKEQQKIGNFFSKLDCQIDLEEQKLEKLEEQKRGYMQKIFSQEFRFKDENGNNYSEWEGTNLGNLLLEINQKSTLNDQYLLLSSTKNGLVNQSDYFKKQIGSKDNTGYKILRLNQMVISPQNLWLGNINFNDQFEIGIVSPSYRIYEFNSKVTFQFLKYLLKTSRYIYEYGQASEQGASVVRRNLNLDLFYEIKVNLPKLVEQEKIGNFFKKIDKSIDKQFNKVELLKERKKGFLQKMFV